MSTALKLRRLQAASWCALAVAFLLFIFVGARTCQRQTEFDRVIAEFKRLGVRTRIGKSEDRPPSHVLPAFVDDFLRRRPQVEVYLHDSAKTDMVLKAVEQNPEVKVIWLDAALFDEAMYDRIKSRIPSVEVGYYVADPLTR